MDSRTIPLEANLGPTHISFTKGCYVGQEIIARIDSRGHTNRAITGFLVAASVLPAAGTALFAPPEEAHPTGREAGWLTSVVAHSPAAGGRAIALGYLRHEYRIPGLSCRCGPAGSAATATVQALPFYSSSYSSP